MLGGASYYNKYASVGEKRLPDQSTMVGQKRSKVLNKIKQSIDENGQEDAKRPVGRPPKQSKKTEESLRTLFEQIEEDDNDSKIMVIRTRNQDNQRKMKKEIFTKKLYEAEGVLRGRYPRIVDRSTQTLLTLDHISKLMEQAQLKKS